MFLPKCIQQRACLLQAQGKDRRLPPATAAQAGSAIAIAAAVAQSRATAKRGTSGRCDRKRQCAKSSASATSVTAPSITTLASQSCQSPASTSAPPAQRLASSSFPASDDDDQCTAERHSSGGGSSSEGSSTPSGRSSCDGSGSGTGSEVEEGPKVESPVSPSLVSSSDEVAPSRDAAHQGPMPTCRVVSKLSCTDPYTCLEVVEVPQPDGTCSPALLMTLLRKHKVTGKPRRKPDNRTPLLLQHLERQAAAHKALGGSPHGVRLLWQSRPGRESDAHMLLLSYESGAVGLDSFMDDLAMDETQREFDAMLAKPKPEKPRRQNPSSSNKTTGKTATPPPAPPPALVLTGRTLVPEPLLKRIAVALLSALAPLHEAGICHGAIAPDCVSVVTASSTEPTPSIGGSSSTQFLVTSCGVAAPVDAAGVVEQRRMRVKGSALEYAAAEVRAHLAAARSGCDVDSEAAVPVVTVACDVASVGLLLLDAAAFRATAGGLRAYTEGRMGLPARLPQGLRDLVARLTAADASQRPSAREALAHPYLQGL